MEAIGAIEFSEDMENIFYLLIHKDMGNPRDRANDALVKATVIGCKS